MPSKKVVKYTLKELATLGHASAKKYAKLQGIARTTKKVRDKNPPKCSTRGCKNPKIPMEWHWVSGKPVYRTVCLKCHERNTASKHGLKNIAQVVAKNAGFDKVSQYLNQFHPYRKHRKTQCENRDGRLGFKCRYTIKHSAQLQVDHKNGNPNDNRPCNLQTLCANCHIYKTHRNKDYASPGRKKLKENA